MNIPSSERHMISKSTFMKGQQCRKALWLYKNKPELAASISAGRQMIFNRGTDVGNLARHLFPNGKDASPIDTFHYPESIKQTYDWIEAGDPIIYEAAFQSDAVIAALDLLVREKDKWYAYEVKSSTKIKPQHIRDTALQYFVMTACGLPVEDIFIIHLNNSYTRTGPIVLKQLFNIVSVKPQVLAMQADIARQIDLSRSVLLLTQEPVMAIGVHCRDPYPCEFIDYCWAHIPDPSVFDLTGMQWGKKFQIYNSGIIEFHQLPEGYALTAAQSLQVRAHLDTHTHIDRNAIRQWLQQLKYPLYFMDFETFGPPIPLYERSRPYQQIPVQFSVHVQRQPGSILEHYEYLGEPETDPRQEFLSQLLKAVGREGSVLVYNRSFESSRLSEIQTDFPTLHADIDNILNRLVDLMEPFREKWYYTPDMNGSYSIKSVLPALIPELSYKELEIGDGNSAMAAFEGLLNITDNAERNTVRAALLEYCKLDTLAMVRILEKLENIL
jgi:hypothetical protein